MVFLFFYFSKDKKEKKIVNKKTCQLLGQPTTVLLNASIFYQYLYFQQQIFYVNFNDLL